MTKTTNKQTNNKLSTAITLALAMVATPSFAGIDNGSGPATYARLAANWWQWALETPNDSSPVLDTTGEFCEVNQKGKYWFLAGTFAGQAERTCTVPAGKSLFFPVINAFTGAFLTDGPREKSIPYLRKKVAFAAECTGLSATLDGDPVTITHERSIPFVINLPEDNLFGGTPDEDDPDIGNGAIYIKNLMVSPSIDEGYYVLLEPLSPGFHDIVFENVPDGNCDFPVKVTYHLTIE